MQVDDQFALHVSSRSSKPRRGLPAAGPNRKEWLDCVVARPSFEGPGRCEPTFKISFAE
jgi:hypothetical protein